MLKEKLPFVLIYTLLLHIPLLALTHGQNDRRRTNTLAVRGLEELFFQLCFCVSFWFLREIVFGFTYLHMLLNSLSAMDGHDRPLKN